MIHYTTRLDKALKTAAWAHEQQGQHRKGSETPYVMHPVAVMLVASNITDNENVLIACLLHDVLEDVESSIYNEDQMRADFGDDVVEIVKGVTKDDRLQDWKERSDAYLAHLRDASDESVIVSGADKIHNLMSILNDFDEFGESLWDRFNSDKDQQKWWYSEILEILQTRMPNSPLTAQLQTLVNRLKEI